MYTVYKYHYTLKRKKCTYFLDGQRNIPFFIMPGYMTILNYYVTYHLNVQVINIVKMYYFQGKQKTS